MRYHDINWQEYEEADDRVMIACVAQHLIKTVWEEVFAKDSRLKHNCGDEEDSEEERYPGEKEETYPCEQELLPEEADPSVAEEEAARGLHVPTPRGRDSCATGSPDGALGGRLGSLRKGNDRRKHRPKY